MNHYDDNISRMSLVCSSSLSGTMQPRLASNPTSVTYFEKILLTMTLEENTGPLRQPAWECTHSTLLTSPQQQCGGADLPHLWLLSSCSSICLFCFLISAWLLLTLLRVHSSPSPQFPSFPTHAFPSSHLTLIGHSHTTSLGIFLLVTLFAK